MNINGLKIFWVDVFTVAKFSGNPSAVIEYKEPLDNDTMQSIASELNLSETVFIRESNFVSNEYEIKWFTPSNEVDLCGHATIAAAKVIFDRLNSNLNSIKFKYKDETISAYKLDNDIYIDLPLDEIKYIDPPDILLNALGTNKVVNCFYGKQTKKIVFCLENVKEIMDLKPNFNEMINCNLDIEIKGVGVTALDENYDCVSRYFNPWFGVNEDPVTGTVHTVLANYWSERLKKNKLYCFQASKRGGEIKMQVVDKTVKMLGQAVILFVGKFE